MKDSHRLIKIFFYFGYIFLYTPILLIIIYSFNKSNTILWQGVSLRWYRSLFQNDALLESCLISLKIAVLSATLSVSLGTLCASAWTRKDNQSFLLGFLATMPLVIPEIIMGLSLLNLFVWMRDHIGWPKGGLFTVIIAHTTLGSAYVTAIVRARLLAIDPTLNEAALDLGARPYQVFFFIKFPLIRPTLIASWLIAFILSFDDVVLASFTAGPGATTLPLVIFSSIKNGCTPQINALATCTIVMAALLIMTTGFIIYRKEER